MSLLQVVDLALAITLLEGVALAAYCWRTGAGVPLRGFIVNLGSGLCLMLALRSALAGAGGGWVVALLLAAGLAHVADLWLRWVPRHATAVKPAAASKHRR